MLIHDLEVRLETTPVNPKQGYYLFNIFIEASLPYAMAFHHEGASEDMGKKFRLIKEIQTGDSLFDPEVFIVSDQPETERLLKNDLLRRSIYELVKSGFSIKVDRDQIAFSFKRYAYDHQSEADQSVLLQAIENIKIVKSELVLHAEVPKKNFDLNLERRYILLILIWLAALAWGIRNFILTPDTDERLLYPGDGAYLFFPALLTFFILFYVNFRILGKHSRTFKRLVILSFLTAPALALNFGTTFQVWNAEKDQNPAHEYPAVLSEKYTTTYKSSTSYHLRYRYGAKLEQTLRADVSSETYAMHLENEKIRVIIHPGFFNIPWFELRNAL